MLTKERDALKQSGRASSASEAALKAKDDLAQEVGRRLLVPGFEV
jgi:hypothetical protein